MTFKPNPRKGQRGKYLDIAICLHPEFEQVEGSGKDRNQIFQDQRLGVAHAAHDYGKFDRTEAPSD